MKHLMRLGLAAILASLSVASADAADTKEVAAARSWLQQNAPELAGEVLDAAVKEGSIMTYCLVSSCPPSLVEAFQKTFPFITMKVYRASGGALAERFSSEVRAKRAVADIVMNSSANILDRFAKEEFLLQWTPSNGQLVPAAFRRDGYWYGIGLLYMGMAWNTDRVTPAEARWLESVSSWKEVYNPVFKGRTALTHPRAGGTSQIVYSYLKETVGNSYIEDMKAKLDPVVFDSINTLAERLASGEYAYTPLAPIDIGVLADLVARGAPIGWHFPEPALALAYAAAIAKNAPRVNAAKLFMAWSVSLTGQSAYVNAVGIGPMRDGVKDERSLARSKYYRLPSTVYEADWGKIDQEVGGMMGEFKRVFNN